MNRELLRSGSALCRHGPSLNLWLSIESMVGSRDHLAPSVLVARAAPPLAAPVQVQNFRRNLAHTHRYQLGPRPADLHTHRPRLIPPRRPGEFPIMQNLCRIALRAGFLSCPRIDQSPDQWLRPQDSLIPLLLRDSVPPVCPLPLRVPSPTTTRVEDRWNLPVSILPRRAI